MALLSPIGPISSSKNEFSVPGLSASFPEPPKILKRIADHDKTAINECLDLYGSLVWALTRNYVTNEIEAEIAVQEVFLDIWKHAGRFDAAKTDEATFISHIACRKLRKRNPGDGIF